MEGDDVCENLEQSLPTGRISELFPTSRGNPILSTEPSTMCLYLSMATAVDTQPTSSMRHVASEQGFLPSGGGLQGAD